MLKKFMILFGACFMGMPMGQGAEPVPDGLPIESDSLSLEKTLELVLKNHPGLEAGGARFRPGRRPNLRLPSDPIPS